MTSCRAALALCLVVAPVSGLAFAMVGGAPPADPAIARHVVHLVGSRGNSCSGVAIAHDIMLTAAHCVPQGADYKLVIFDVAHQPQLKDVATVARHPQFQLAALLAHRATAGPQARHCPPAGLRAGPAGAARSRGRHRG